MAAPSNFAVAVARARAALRTVHPFNGRSEFVSVAAIKAAAGQLGPGMERAELEAMCAHCGVLPTGLRARMGNRQGDVRNGPRLFFGRGHIFLQKCLTVFCCFAIYQSRTAGKPDGT
jgi:hypothetical protein